MAGDLRALSHEQFAKASETMQAIVRGVAAADEGADHVRGRLSADGADRRQRKLLALYDQASRDLGAGPVTAVNPDRAGAADVSFVAGDVPMIIDGIGMAGRAATP